jgi:hypothetical protein
MKVLMHALAASCEDWKSALRAVAKGLLTEMEPAFLPFAVSAPL